MFHILILVPILPHEIWIVYISSLKSGLPFSTWHMKYSIYHIWKFLFKFYCMKVSSIYITYEKMSPPSIPSLFQMEKSVHQCDKQKPGILYILHMKLKMTILNNYISNSLHFAYENNIDVFIPWCTECSVFHFTKSGC